MAWRTLLISQPGKLSAFQERLRLAQQEVHYLPFDDLVAIVIDSPQVVITSACLAKLAAYNIALFSCQDHLPNGIFLGFQPHSRQAKVVQEQMNWSEPFKKRLQQRIIQNKINHQALVLKTVNHSMGEKLKSMSQQVDSGDTQNLEGQAAALYFKHLFEDFTRKQDCLHNAALNYGYAILRGVAARSLVAGGFLPCRGIFHQSELNAFNLADDVMEPFRPFVDSWVLQELGRKPKVEALTSTHKEKLLKILYQPCRVGGEKLYIFNGIEKVVQSLGRASTQKKYPIYQTVEPLSLKPGEVIEFD